MKRPKLAKLELRILEALWAQGRASMREIQETFPEPRPAYTTITNTVYRMEAKRAVRRVRKIGNADIFEPLIAKDAARDGLLDEILELFRGTAATHDGAAHRVRQDSHLTTFAKWKRPRPEADRQRKAERMRKSK